MKRSYGPRRSSTRGVELPSAAGDPASASESLPSIPKHRTNGIVVGPGLVPSV